MEEMGDGGAAGGRAEPARGAPEFRVPLRISEPARDQNPNPTECIAVLHHIDSNLSSIALNHRVLKN
eukprot:scaffold38495_cov23-Cyclotella_meneghiniana.AAC.1